MRLRVDAILNRWILDIVVLILFCGFIDAGRFDTVVCLRDGPLGCCSVDWIVDLERVGNSVW